MKKSIILNLFLLLGFIGSAQTYSVMYEVSNNIDDQLKQIPDEAMRQKIKQQLSIPKYYLLENSNAISMYQQVQNINKDSVSDIENASTSNTKVLSFGSKSNGIYKNFQTQEFLQEANIFDKEFLIKDTLQKLNWELTDDTKSIGKFECKKAILKIDNKITEAWYTTDIPIMDGPSTYYGLPGLILEVITPNNTFTALKVDIIQQSKTFTKPSAGKPITKKAFDKLMQEKVNELKANNGMIKMRSL